MKTYCSITTDLGYIALAQEDGRLINSTLPKASTEDALRDVGVGAHSSHVEDCDSFGDLPDLLRRYARGEAVDFSKVDVNLDSFGSFHTAALRACQGIPYGQIVTYRELARLAGSDRAARAAGSAMANNIVPIIIPCHRVIASGGIGGFSAGLEWKRHLLRLEGVEIK